MRAVLIGLAAASGLHAAWVPSPVRGTHAGASSACRMALAAPASTVATVPTAAPATEMLESFSSMFVGHFDNHAQVTSDRAVGMAPREGGGHEHIHCRLQRVPYVRDADERLVLARYYFDGVPTKPFRTRLYALRALDDDPDFGHCVHMAIYRLRDATEALVSAARGDVDAAEWTVDDLSPSLKIPDCDIFWKGGVAGRFDGRMRTDSIVVHSPVLNKPIVVKDDVALWEDALWCNDRGEDLDGGYVYGNTRGVPYQMRRVAEGHWTAVGADLARPNP